MTALVPVAVIGHCPRHGDGSPMRDRDGVWSCIACEVGK